MEKRNITLLVLLLLAIITRFFGIEFQSLWIDEGATFYYSHYTWEQFTTVNEPNSPIYYMMEGLALDILGHTEFALRLTSAISGVIVVVLAFFVAEKMFDNWRFATIASILFLTSMVCIEYSQEARGYEIVLMLFLIQVYVLMCAIEEKRYCFWILLAIVSAISITMQYTSILATATIYLYALYHYWSKNKNLIEIKKILISGIIFVILTIPLWTFMIEALTFHNNCTFNDSIEHGLSFTIRTIQKLLCGNEYWGIAVLLFVLCVKGAIYCYKTHREKFVFLTWVIIFPLLITTIISVVKNLRPKYIIWSVTGYLIFVALSFYSFDDETKILFKRKINITKALTIFIVILICCTSIPHYYTTQHKDDFRGAGECLSQYAESGDILIYRGDENLDFAALSFYFMPSEHGVDYEQFNPTFSLI